CCGRPSTPFRLCLIKRSAACENEVFRESQEMKTRVILTLSMLLGWLVLCPSARAASLSVNALNGATGRLHGINNLNQAVGNTVGGDEVEAVFYQNGATT